MPLNHRIVIMAFAGLALQGASVLSAETAPSVTTVSAASGRAGEIGRAHV